MQENKVPEYEQVAKKAFNTVICDFQMPAVPDHSDPRLRDPMRLDGEQTGLLAIVSAWPKVEAADDPKAYAYRCAYHAISKWLAKERDRPQHEDGTYGDVLSLDTALETAADLVDRDSDPAGELVAAELLTTIYESCADEIDTRIVRFRLESEAKPLTEIAELVRRTPDAVRKRLRAIGQRLAKKVDIPTRFRNRFSDSETHR